MIMLDKRLVIFIFYEYLILIFIKFNVRVNVVLNGVSKVGKGIFVMLIGLIFLIVDNWWLDVIMLD